MALLLGEMAIQLGGAMERALLGGAVAIAVLAAATKGPLGAIRALPRGAHRALDAVVGAGLALSPLSALHHLDVVGVLLAEGAALVVLRLAFITRYHAPARAPGRPSGLARVRTTGLVGRIRAAVSGPAAEAALGAGARRLGGAVGRRAPRRPQS